MIHISLLLLLLLACEVACLLACLAKEDDREQIKSDSRLKEEKIET